jgi:hypothetical protein
MSGGLLMWIRMKTWQTCWRIHWVVQSEPSLFGWFCIMFSQRKGMGIWEEIKSFLLPPRIGTTYPFAHTVWVFKFRVGAVSFNRFRVGAVGFCWLGFLFYFLDEMIGQPKTVSWVIVSPIGLRGVFQYCVTRYLIVWPFLGALPFSTVLAVSENMTFECKRSRSRKARQSFHHP